MLRPLAVLMLAVLFLFSAAAAFADVPPVAGPEEPQETKALSEEARPENPEPPSSDASPVAESCSPAAPAPFVVLPFEELITLACNCRDLCISDSQCVFFCGPQGGSCQMVNSCCRECVCSASS